MWGKIDVKGPGLADHLLKWEGLSKSEGWGMAVRHKGGGIKSLSLRPLGKLGKPHVG